MDANVITCKRSKTHRHHLTFNEVCINYTGCCCLKSITRLNLKHRNQCFWTPARSELLKLEGKKPCRSSKSRPSFSISSEDLRSQSKPADMQTTPAGRAWTPHHITEEGMSNTNPVGQNACNKETSRAPAILDEKPNKPYTRGKTNTQSWRQPLRSNEHDPQPKV